MSQPAIARGKLYMAYPTGSRGHQAFLANQKPASHALLCADLKTGKHIWNQGIAADVQSAPVIDGDKVYFTCMDGTSYCLDAQTGKVIWQKASSGTSAPVISHGKMYMSNKLASAGGYGEGLQMMDARQGKMEAPLSRPTPAPYLSKGGEGSLLNQKAQSELDASVGFASAPSTAGLSKAADHLGVSTVSGAWAYQGSRAAVSKNGVFNAAGKFINGVSSDERNKWQAELKGKDVRGNAQMFSPPSLGKENMYLVSSGGYIMSVNQVSGSPQFLYSTGQPITFQPALANGNIYVGTSNGQLLCLETGTNDADGWTAWGGNAQHNKTDSDQKIEIKPKDKAGLKP
jgi:outer membrane protein assembly factor BamB